MHGKYGNDWFEPTPFGRNWLRYWMPLVVALVQCFMISFVTVGVTSPRTLSANTGTGVSMRQNLELDEPAVSGCGFRANQRQTVGVQVVLPSRVGDRRARGRVGGR